MSSKTIVTHIFPDLDAIASVWLLRRFDQDFEEAELKFVPAGSSLEGSSVDSDPDIVHVDTGGGRFDHHQENKRNCAAELVFNYLKSRKLVTLKHQRAIKRLVEVVIEVDQFEDFFWPESGNDRYEFMLHHLFDHLKLSGKLNDLELVEEGERLLNAILFGLRQKIHAEKEILEGQEFNSKWGRTLAIETQMSRVCKMAQKQGYHLVVRKEPNSKFVSIKCQPKKDLDLTLVYEKLKQADPKADWYFHQSKHIILNGSRHDKKVKPSSLNLEELIKIVKSF